MSNYNIDLQNAEPLTDAQATDHMEDNGWRADAPEYVYDNVLIWDGGFGLLLVQERSTAQFYYVG